MIREILSTRISWKLWLCKINLLILRHTSLACHCVLCGTFMTLDTSLRWHSNKPFLVLDRRRTTVVWNRQTKYSTTYLWKKDTRNIHYLLVRSRNKCSFTIFCNQQMHFLPWKWWLQKLEEPLSLYLFYQLIDFINWLICVYCI